MSGATSPCAKDGHSIAIGMHSLNSNIRLAIEIASKGVLPMETTFFTKMLRISIATL